MNSPYKKINHFWYLNRLLICVVMFFIFTLNSGLSQSTECLGAKISVSQCILPAENDTTLEIYAEGGTADIIYLEVNELKSIWEEGFNEKYRPQFHYTAPENWLNDPNGLVYYAGEYHLFHQYNPYGREWGNMHWYHAVGTDLVHWEHLGIALSMDEHGYGDEVFSGSAVVDHNNTSGFQTGDEKVIVAIYTISEKNYPYSETQNIAYSNDRGRTWNAYEGNPVILCDYPGDQRDPKVFWYEPDQKWVMSLYEDGGIAFYSSPNLKDWTYMSRIDGFNECPDLFELPIDGDPTNRAWVVHDASGKYLIGQFNGNKFIPSQAEVPEGIIIADFEGEDYGAWIITGSAFGDNPAHGTLPYQQLVSGYLGDQLVNTYLDGDEPTGTANSPEFNISKDFINFLIGGGNHPGKACINLVIDDSTVFSATGKNDEHLVWSNWDVSDYKGESAKIKIIDAVSGGWGHINIDHIMLSNESLSGFADKCDLGSNYYAAQSYSNISETDNRRIQIGWMRDGEYPGMPFNQQMSFPRELTLRNFEEGLRLCKQPVREINKLHKTTHDWENTQLSPGENLLDGISCKLLDIRSEIDLSKADEFGFVLCGQEIRYMKSTETLHAAGKEIHLLPSGGSITLQILLDRTSVEVFAGGIRERTDIEIGYQNLSNPRSYSLSQNYPNPFNPSTKIDFKLPKNSKVSLKLYNALGQKVETLLDKKVKAGIHSIRYNGSNLSSGIYFYRLNTGDFKATRKCLLMK